MQKRSRQERRVNLNKNQTLVLFMVEMLKRRNTTKGDWFHDVWRGRKVIIIIRDLFDAAADGDLSTFFTLESNSKPTTK